MSSSLHCKNQFGTSRRCHRSRQQKAPSTHNMARGCSQQPCTAAETRVRRQAGLRLKDEMWDIFYYTCGQYSRLSVWPVGKQIVIKVRWALVDEMFLMTEIAINAAMPFILSWFLIYVSCCLLISNYISCRMARITLSSRNEIKAWSDPWPVWVSSIKHRRLVLQL